MNRRPEAEAIPQDTLAGIGLMSAAMLIVPVMDIIAKYLSASLPPLEVTFGRFLFQMLLCIAGAVVLGKVQDLRSRHFGINLLRGLLLTAAVLCFFWAVKYLPVATAIAIFFVEPLILTVLAAIILKEPFGLHRTGAIIVGLIGAMLILRPSFADAGLASLLPLGTALFFASYLILNRIYAGTDSLMAIQFTTGLAGTVALGAALLIGTMFGIEAISFVTPSLAETGLLLAIGAISLVGHGLVVLAFARAEASTLAPLNYLEIVSATLLGFLVFGDFPDALTWAGIALIVASGLYIAHRERVRHPAEPTHKTPRNQA